MNERETQGVVRMSSGKRWSGIVFAFVMGLILGGIVMAVLVRTHAVRVMREGRPPLNKMVAERVTGNLGLTPDQRAQLKQIVNEYDSAFVALRDSSRAEVRRTVDQMEGRIREILTPEQQTKFDLNVAHIHAELKKRAEHERAERAHRHGEADSAR